MPKRIPGAWIRRRRALRDGLELLTDMKTLDTHAFGEDVSCHAEATVQGAMAEADIQKPQIGVCFASSKTASAQRHERAASAARMFAQTLHP